MGDSPVKKRVGMKKQLIDSDDDMESKPLYEMDVIICDTVPNSELYRIQLPNRKRDAFDERSNPRMRYKKKSKVMELRLDADIHSQSYDKDKMDRLPPRAHDSATNMPPEVYEGRCFDSSNPIQYAVAFVKNSKMYMYPLDGSVEMRRSLAHINFADKKKKAEDTDGNTTGESENESGTTSTAIRVKFSRQETDRQKKRREASALHRERTIAEENWLNLDMVNDVDNVSSRLRAVSISPVRDEEKKKICNEDVIETTKLIRTTLGGVQEEKQSLELADCPTLSLLNASSLPANLQVRSILLKSLSITTSSLSSLLSPPLQREQLIPVVRQFARLVRGVWVVKSDLLFRPPLVPGVRPSRMTESRGKLWREARDFALCLIDANLRVTRSTISRVFRLSRDDAHEVLETIGISDEKKRTWTLLSHEHEDITKDDLLYPIQVEDAEYWAERWAEIMREVGEKNSPRRVRRQSNRSNN